MLSVGTRGGEGGGGGGIETDGKVSRSSMDQIQILCERSRLNEKITGRPTLTVEYSTWNLSHVILLCVVLDTGIDCQAAAHRRG